jgi:hypothetical protein
MAEITGNVAYVFKSIEPLKFKNSLFKNNGKLSGTYDENYDVYSLFVFESNLHLLNIIIYEEQ